MDKSHPYDFSQYAGCDVGSKEIALAVRRGNGVTYPKTFDNTAKGITALVKYLCGPGEPIRVCLETTGRYSLDLALALDACELTVVIAPDPGRMRKYAQSLGEWGKTDEVDAKVLLHYAAERPHPVWRAPSAEVLQLRDTSRRLGQIKDALRRAENQLHALTASAQGDPFVRENIERHIAFLKQEKAVLEARIDDLLDASEELARDVAILRSAPGIGKVFGPLLAAELGTLSRSLNSAKVTALAGLDPVPYRSGTSVRGRSRISKRGNSRVRSAMYQAAMVAMGCNPAAERFYQHLSERRGKPGKVAMTALARKLLVALWSMLRNEEEWDSSKLCPNIDPVEST